MFSVIGGPTGKGHRGGGGVRWSGVAAIALFVGGIIAVVAGTVMSIVAVVGLASEGGARRDAVVDVDVPGTASVSLDTGSYVALALGNGLVRSSYDPVRELTIATRGPFAPPQIAVTGPDGSPLELRSPRVETLEDRPGTDAASIVEFTVRAAGTHTISVESGSGSEGPVTSVILRESGGLAGFGIGSLVIGFVVAFAGGAAILAGVLLGVISLVRRR